MEKGVGQGKIGQVMVWLSQ